MRSLKSIVNVKFEKIQLCSVSSSIVPLALFLVDRLTSLETILLPPLPIYTQNTMVIPAPPPNPAEYTTKF